MGALPDKRINSVCIIGAGPSGLAAANYLLAEQSFSSIRIFEQRSNVGGLWNQIASFSGSDSIRSNVPQTSPHAGHDEPLWTAPDAGLDGKASDTHNVTGSTFMSAVYDRLETNIPRGLMGFSDLDWPNDCQLFPGHQAVLEYLERYAEDVSHLIQFQTQVRRVGLSGDGRWEVETQPIPQKDSHVVDKHTFDAVVVCNGHFNVPYVPAVPGIEAWKDAYPGSIMHSMFYRKPESFANQKVIVVGNSASGVDISGQIATACKLPLLVSQKSVSKWPPDEKSTKVEKPQIVEYIIENRQVRFADGTTETGVDAVVYCTGYFYSYPFLDSLQPPLIGTGEYVKNLYQHIFYRPHPTLAFVALNQKIIPFPIAEVQSAVIARVFSDKLALPSETEMRRWESKTLDETGGGRNFHVLPFPKDADYICMMHDWAISAEKPGDSCSELYKRRMSSDVIQIANLPIKALSNDGGGGCSKEPPYWGEREYWTRERFPAIKQAFQSFGANRHSRRTLEDVGFSFDDWKKEKIEEAQRLL